MKLNGAMVLKGIFRIKHYNKKGRLLSDETLYNTVTNTGKAEIAGLINEQTSIGFKWLALDASSTAAAASDTALASEITSPSLNRAAATCSRVTTSVTNDTAQALHTWNSTATQTVYGVGLFDSSSNGVMASRVTFAAKNLESGDTLQVTHKLQVV